MNFIINIKGRKITKETIAYLSILPIAFIIIFLTYMVNYKTVYKVTLNGKLLGYIEERENVEKEVNDYKNYSGGNIAFIDLKSMPEYEEKVVLRSTKTDDEKEVVEQIKATADILYKSYAITLDGETKGVVESIAEAQTIVDGIKEELNADLELDIGITEVFSDNLNDLMEYTVAKEQIDEEIDDIVKEFELTQKQESILNGIAICRPLEEGVGTITSRFGIRSSGNHTGLDVAAPTGTAIHPVAEGVVTCSEYKGSYGNLIIIDHGEGIETYYAHCSALYASVGDVVDIDDTISAVGSTGNSTGPHLHIEFRINGEIIDPQTYIYK